MYRLEEESFRRDFRVVAAEEGDGDLVSVDRRRMCGTVRVLDGRLEVPILFEVCDVCSGRGSHVNPGVDFQGLTAEDFAEDPEFAEEYFRGVYDVPCYGCRGNRVRPLVDRSRVDPKVLDALDAQARGRREMREEELAERRWGA